MSDPTKKHRFIVSSVKSVGTVSAGANPECDVVFAKVSRDIADALKDGSAVREGLIASRLDGAADDVTRAAKDLREFEAKYGRKMSGARQAQYRAAMKTLLGLAADLGIEDDEKDSEEEDKMPKKDAKTEAPAFDESTLDEAGKAYVAGLRGEIETLKGEVTAAKATPPAPITDPEEAAKALPEGTPGRELIIAGAKANKELNAKLEAETLKREQVEFTAKAAKEYPHTPGADAAKGDYLRCIENGLPVEGDAKAALLATLKAGDSAIAESMKAKGHSKPGDDSTSAKAKLETIAAKYREDDPKLTKAQANAKAYAAHPELYRDARVEQSATRH